MLAQIDRSPPSPSNVVSLPQASSPVKQSHKPGLRAYLAGRLRRPRETHPRPLPSNPKTTPFGGAALLCGRRATARSPRFGVSEEEEDYLLYGLLHTFFHVNYVVYSFP